VSQPYWRVGQANDPQPEDKTYNDESAAIAKAKHRADCDWKVPVAVWDERDEIVHLFLCGQHFQQAIGGGRVGVSLVIK
jgi:hypothetical protein